MARAVALAFLSLVVGGLAKSVTPFAEKMLGTWLPQKGYPLKSILGPVAYDFLGSGPGSMNVGLTALRDNTTGDVWFTLLNGQMWRVVGDQVQYCFGEGVLAEQSPFEIDKITNKSVNICWRTGDRGMPTHTKGCQGCDCARILLSLTDDNTLHFQFWMSPPVLHADLMFVRSGPQPLFKDAISSTLVMPYSQCTVKDHYGPNLPGEPDLRNKTYTKPERISSSGCAATSMLFTMKNDDMMASLGEFSQEKNEQKNADAGQCHQLNGLQLASDVSACKKDPSKCNNVSDVKMQYIVPTGKCDPCDVSYSISAKIEQDEYIGFGFKGQSWEHEDPYPPEVSRPCYFGMCVDKFDNFTSDRLAVGYTANGGCVREMVSPNIVGEPVDVDFRLLKKTSIERNGDRAIMRFTISQHWPQKPWPAGGLVPDGPFRVMWAIGKVSGNDGNGCTAKVGYHAHHRGVAPVTWLFTLGSTPCKYNPDEMGGPAVITV